MRRKTPRALAAALLLGAAAQPAAAVQVDFGGKLEWKDDSGRTTELESVDTAGWTYTQLFHLAGKLSSEEPKEASVKKAFQAAAETIRKAIKDMDYLPETRIFDFSFIRSSPFSHADQSGKSSQGVSSNNSSDSSSSSSSSSFTITVELVPLPEATQSSSSQSSSSSLSLLSGKSKGGPGS